MEQEHKFTMFIGTLNPVLPGKAGKTYWPEVSGDSLIFKEVGDGTAAYEIPLSDIEKAYFGRGSGYLWLQLEVRNKGYVPLSAKYKAWRHETAAALVEAIGRVTPVDGTKYFDHIRKSPVKFFFFG